jgi:hypothetical protein
MGKGGQKASQRLEAGRDASPSLRRRGQATVKPSQTAQNPTFRPHFVHISSTFAPQKHLKSAPKRPFASTFPPPECSKRKESKGFLAPTTKNLGAGCGQGASRGQWGGIVVMEGVSFFLLWRRVTLKNSERSQRRSAGSPTHLRACLSPQNPLPSFLVVDEDDWVSEGVGAEDNQGGFVGWRDLHSLGTEVLKAGGSQHEQDDGEGNGHDGQGGQPTTKGCQLPLY